MTVLITGGTGSLGTALVRAVAGAGHRARVMSRRPPPASAPGDLEWKQADIASGAGVREAADGADAIVHAASDPRHAAAVDVGGTRHLVEAARAAGVGHIVYVSIVGGDRIPLAYYKHKLAAEEIVRSSGVPHTIARVTQFHSFLDALLSAAARLP